jgi:acetoacetate decarboxylase
MMKKSEFGFSMPLPAPLYEAPPYDYQAEFVQAYYLADTDKISGLVPEPLEPAPSGLATCFVAWYSSVTGLGPYHEAFFLVGVNYKGRAGLFCPLIWVDSDAALAAGREIWGFPKKMANISLKREKDKASGIVERGGMNIIQMEVNREREPSLPDRADGEIYLLRVIPSPDGKEPPERRLVTLTLGTGGGRETSELKAGETIIRLSGSGQDPVDLLEPQKILGGMSGLSRFSLPYGKTVEILR